MSEPYTPDTDEVRECWASAEVNPDGYTYEGLPVPDEAEQYAEFDLWLAGVKADAWDEGYRAGSQDMSDLRAGRLTFQTITSNPYRQEADHA